MIPHRSPFPASDCIVEITLKSVSNLTIVCSVGPFDLNQYILTLSFSDKNKTPRERGFIFSPATGYSPRTGLGPSTIAAGGLNGRVRDGNGCDPAATGTKTVKSLWNARS